jgi:hypothetical protein
MRLSVYVGPCKPPLRSSGRDANRTRRNVSSRAFPRPGPTGPAAAENPRSSKPARERHAGGLQRGRAIGKTNEVGPVTANAMAELMPRDFFKAAAGLKTRS